ncbi:4-alpha-glucanotransferase [Clostridium sp. D33t1_170424_F3]|uniref:4-alpha-glucanotransferase n=1 Tax=Clostridium sp. D33t1_170424_F3 TaxID=2787099 RepID=UPI0018A95D20|nr:4-alpha-glucanotransferase [Clostridium sp. D33t1_170424_F3]
MPKINKQLPRGAGILLPVSSLPSPYGIGTLGRDVFAFVDFLTAAGQTYWQVLPVGPTSFGDSPYQSFSAFAGNPYFIDLDTLVEEGLLEKREVSGYSWGTAPDDVDYERLFRFRFPLLRQAFRRSRHQGTEAYRRFCEEQKNWLGDYSLFMALKERFDNQEWLCWPEELRLRQPEAIAHWEAELAEERAFWSFCQYKFFEQWNRVKAYANEKGVQIIGDIPIYVALDSADVWVHGGLFQLDELRRPVSVAGVPPDAFSTTGQLWGNPLYDWDAMEQTDFTWWKERMAHSAKLYDVIRVDHFIGVVRYYAIPYGSETAATGEWREGPGAKLVKAIDSAVGQSKVIAEDLGVVVPQVRKVLKQAGYPSMKIIQFGFDSDARNEHLPHNYTQNMVVYGGTHDNETLAGRYNNMKPADARYAMKYLQVRRRNDIPKAVVIAGYASVANTVLFQMQDLLFLPNSARMNFPSTLGGNWRWRLRREQLKDELASWLKELTELYGR